MPDWRQPLRAGAALEFAQRRFPAIRQAALPQAVEHAALLRRQCRHPRLPGVVVRQAAAPGLAPGGLDVLRDLEGRMRPAQMLPCCVGVGLEDASAMGAARAFHARDAAADDGPAGDHRRPRIGLRLLDRGANRLGVVAVHLLHVPAADAEAGGHVVGQRDVDRTVVGHAIIVPQEDELAEAQMPRQRDHLLPDALLQAAVADQSVGVMIDDLRPEPLAQESLGDRHPGRVGDALPEQARGHLDAAARVIFGMALAVRPEHPEPLDLLDAHLLVAGQVEQRIDQHRAVAGRLHEAVAVEPQRVLRIELEMVPEQRRRDVGRAERRAGVALARALDRVHGQEADCVGHQPRIDAEHDLTNSSMWIGCAGLHVSRMVEVSTKPEAEAPAG